jgi:hypothetical protein
VLVTNDRVLVSYAHQHAIATIESDLFYTKVAAQVSALKQSATHSSTATRKAIDYQSSPLVDELMMQSAEKVYDKDDVAAPTSRQSLGKTLSSREKKLQRLVKKL